ncbi:hypothetical protein [Deinococcus depolymerans]|uniref:Uncharacterized protein n=1 Tax=Deinococcus depolymerans TaxID=392408 RepID=A0ABP3LZ58_9DEIO
MTIQRQITAPLNFHVGPIFEKFEDIRVGAAQKLFEVREGTVGILKLRQKQYRILAEEDYQLLYGMAKDAELLSKEISLVLQAAVVVGESDTEASRTMLKMAALQVKEKIRLTTLDGSAPADPFDFDLGDFDEDDSLDM